LGAILFPSPLFDKTLGAERLFFYGPEKFTDVRTYDAAKQWLNFGTIEIDDIGNLTTTIRKVDGTVVFQESLEPQH
jgi:hypothetical protein